MLKSRITGRRLLVCTVGLPYAGKSEWALSEARSLRCPIVCPDSLRMALHGKRFDENLEPLVWLMARVATKAHFLSGQAVVLIDATNMTRARRDDWARYLKLDNLRVEFRDFMERDPAAMMRTCIERATRANDRDILPVIDRMAAQYEALAEDELRYGVS